MFLTLDKWKQVLYFFKGKLKTLQGFFKLLAGLGVMGFIGFRVDFEKVLSVGEEIKVTVNTMILTCLVILIILVVFDEVRFAVQRFKKFKPNKDEKLIVEYLQTVPPALVVDVAELSHVLELNVEYVRKTLIKFKGLGLVRKTYDVREEDGEYAYQVKDELYLMDV